MYLDAGANVITANTFGALPLKVGEGRYSVKEYLTKEIQLLNDTIEEAEKAGIKGPHFSSWDTSQIGRLLEPMGDLTFDQAYENYKEAAIIAEQAGADLAIIETMSDLHEVKAAVLAVQENTKLPIVATMTFQKNLRTLTGADVQTCVTYLESLHVDVLGFNCGGDLAEGEELTRQFCKYSHTPVLVQPNAGLPVVKNGKAVFLVKPEKFAASQVKNRRAGAVLLGGCCGTTPDHIKALIESTRDEKISPKAIREKVKDADSTFICSYNKTVQIGGWAGPMIVGERIQIDSSEGPVIEKALRYYNGKALINSVNGRQEVMDKIFPLVAHYGGTLVALCIDENGIAPTAEGRVKVAKKIINEAAKYGIPVRDIVIDTLTLTVSSQQKEALETCRAISILKKQYGKQGLKFILGVSNISFGLPRRDIINSRFFAMALYAGLDACIINPLSDGMLETYYGYRALQGFDANCLSYIEKYNGTTAPLYGVSADQIFPPI